MDLKNIRWIQRYVSFRKACAKVLVVTRSAETPDRLSELEKEGLVQRFEYTYELAWKTLQDLLRYRGYADIAGPNPVLKQAFADRLLTDHDGWRRMGKVRNTTSHIYDEDEADTVVSGIFSEYAPLLVALDHRLWQEICDEGETAYFDSLCSA